MKMLKELIYGDFDRVKVYLIRAKKKKESRQNKSEFRSKQKIIQPETLLVHAQGLLKQDCQTLFSYSYLNQDFLLCLLRYILHLYKPCFARFSFKKKAARLNAILRIPCA